MTFPNYTLSDLKFSAPQLDQSEQSNITVNIISNPFNQGKVDESQSAMTSDTNLILISPHNDGKPKCTGYNKRTQKESNPCHQVVPRLVEAITTINNPSTGYRVKLSSMAAVEKNKDTGKYSLYWRKESKNNNRVFIDTHYLQRGSASEHTKAFNALAINEHKKALDHAKALMDYYTKQSKFV